MNKIITIFMILLIALTIFGCVQLKESTRDTGEENVDDLDKELNDINDDVGNLDDLDKELDEVDNLDY